MTTGGSTVQAIEAVRAEGYDVVGVVPSWTASPAGREAIALASGDAPYEALATIDDVYPDRPDRPRTTLGRMPPAGIEPASRA